MRTVASERRRIRTVALAAVGYAGLIAATMVQTYDGRSPLDLAVGSSVATLFGLVLLGWSGLIALRGVGAAQRATAEPGEAQPEPVNRL